MILNIPRKDFIKNLFLTFPNQAFIQKCAYIDCSCLLLLYTSNFLRIFIRLQYAWQKLLSSQSDVYLWFKTVFKHLVRICQCIALGNKLLTMPHRPTEEKGFYQMQHLPFFISSDKQNTEALRRGLMWIAIHFTARSTLINWLFCN